MTVVGCPPRVRIAGVCICIVWKAWVTLHIIVISMLFKSNYVLWMDDRMNCFTHAVIKFPHQEATIICLLQLIICKNVLGPPGVPAGTRYEQQQEVMPKTPDSRWSWGHDADSHPFSFISSRSFSLQYIPVLQAHNINNALPRTYVHHWSVNV